ncbi:PREDICTED: uncharacterized protein LOC109581507 isoform X2 [Amphimedon queenslandica]|uniref:Uncharacterized protein n=1 Tax=Amphimedon queenslandica TaxID=400682 RepID=A0AAN0J2F6_AMPQE|nr:PREDICTED: uncharacterized protein LOC109581507 isoform X2 [Amphimedon queenslandica]|eukprot:XP_019851224.1 PREDICTED: uncharacterized protein LOC109581507 isoform X2 [Amphimedon queenslandica]
MVARATPVACMGKWAFTSINEERGDDHVTSCFLESFLWTRVVALLLAKNTRNMAEGGRKEEEINPLFGERCLDDPEEVFQHNSWDHIEWDKDQLRQAEETIKVNFSQKLSDEEQSLMLSYLRVVQALSLRISVVKIYLICVALFMESDCTIHLIKEYLPILVEKPTCDFLKTWIARGLSIPPSRITALLVEDRYGKLVPMDNLSLKGINKRIYFDIKQEDEKGSMRITLKESPTKDENGKRGQHSKS